MFQKTKENILRLIDETYERIPKAEYALYEALKEGDVRENYSVTMWQNQIQVENARLIRLQKALGHPTEEGEDDENYGMVFSAEGRIERVYEDEGTVRCRNGLILVNKPVDYDLTERSLMEKAFLNRFIFLCFPDSSFLFNGSKYDEGTVFIDYNSYKAMLEGKKVGDDFVWSSREYPSGLLYDVKFTITDIEHVLTKYNL